MKNTKPNGKAKKKSKAKETYVFPYEYYELAYKIGAHVVAGRPAIGKTSFAIGCINDCIRSEYPIAYVSLDMTKNAFYEHLEKKISPSEIIYATKFKLFFYSEEGEITRLLPYLKSLRDNGVKAVIIDFVQLLKVNGNPLDTDHLVAILSAFALKHQMSIILLCQLTNNSKDVYPFAQTIHILRKETEQ